MVINLITQELVIKTAVRKIIIWLDSEFTSLQFSLFSYIIWTLISLLCTFNKIFITMADLQRNTRAISWVESWFQHWIVFNQNLWLNIRYQLNNLFKVKPKSNWYEYLVIYILWISWWTKYKQIPMSSFSLVSIHDITTNTTAFYFIECNRYLLLNSLFYLIVM